MIKIGKYYINADNIAYVTEIKSGTKIVLVNGETLMVELSVEKVVRMLA